MGKNNTNKNTYEYFYVYCIENIINYKTYTGYHKGRPTDTYMGSDELIQKAIKLKSL